MILIRRCHVPRVWLSRISLDLVGRLGINASRIIEQPRTLGAPFHSGVGILDRLAVLVQVDAHIAPAVVGVAILRLQPDRFIKIVQG